MTTSFSMLPDYTVYRFHLEGEIEDMRLSDRIHCVTSPMHIRFPNGKVVRISFRGMDKEEMKGYTQSFAELLQSNFAVSYTLYEHE